MAHFGAALHSWGDLAIPSLRKAPKIDRSVGRLDMAFASAKLRFTCCGAKRVASRRERKPRHPILRSCSAFRPLCWSIGYGEETSPSHPEVMLRFPTAFSP